MTVNQCTTKDDAFLNAFYAIGKAVRLKHSPDGIVWTDDDYIEELLEEAHRSTEMFIAQEGDDEGRLAVMRAPNEEHIGLIGWFECDDNQELCNALMEKAKQAISAMGCTKILGPINGNTWHSYRLNRSSEMPLMPGDPYNPKYYLKLWEKAGFHAVEFYESAVADKAQFIPMTMEEGRDLAKKFNLSVDYFPEHLTDQELDLLYDFYNKCFRENPLFTPIRKETYRVISRRIEPYVNNAHSLIIKDREGKPVAVLLSHKDTYHEQYKAGKIKHPLHVTKKLLVKTIAVDSDYRNNQIGTLMVNLILNLANQNNYDEFYHVLMYQKNITAVKGREKFVTKNAREYCIYEMEL